MVSKCANRECGATFRYFHTGQLFRMQVPAAKSADQSEMKASVPRMEFFWLCDDCARKMTLVYQLGEGVMVRPRLTRAAVAA